MAIHDDFDWTYPGLENFHPSRSRLAMAAERERARRFNMTLAERNAEDEQKRQETILRHEIERKYSAGSIIRELDLASFDAMTERLREENKAFFAAHPHVRRMGVHSARLYNQAKAREQRQRRAYYGY